jgi:GT2 family glycosyltransferase
MPQAYSAEAQPLVSIIILNYNGLDFLPDCLESLRKTSYPRTELIVVDNSSRDGSLEYLRTHHPEVRLFPLTENFGFSAAYNAVIPQANGEVVVLLNFDVEVEPDWLNQAIEVLSSDPSVAAVQPKLRSLQRREQFEYSGGSGGFIDRYGYPFVRGRVFDFLEADHGQYDSVTPIFWASGAACVIRRSLYDKSGGLDSDFFLHMEELDLCWRFWLMGYSVMAAPSGVVYHYAGAALSAERFAKMYFNHRNGLVMMLKNYSWKSLGKYLPVRFMLDLVTLLVSPFRGEGKRSLAVFAAYSHILFHLPRIMRKRRVVQRLRTRDDSTLSHVVMPFSIVRRCYLQKQRTFSQLVSAR